MYSYYISLRTNVRSYYLVVSPYFQKDNKDKMYDLVNSEFSVYNKKT